MSRHDCRLVERLAPGVGLIASKLAFPTLAERWVRRPPIYLHRAMPVQLTVAAESLRGSFRTLLPRVRPDVPFCVQVQAVDGLSPEAHGELESWCERVTVSVRRPPRDVRRPGQIVSVVLAGGRAFAGVAPVRWMLTGWPGGVPAFPLDAGRVNRAEVKLLEAFCVFGLRLGPGAECLDLGASPGGWTRALLLRGGRVTAVDPHPRGMQVEHPALRHVAAPAEEFLASASPGYDFIVNDMYQKPADSARLMAAAARLLKPEGSAVMTLKLPLQGGLGSMDRALRILRGAYRIPRLRQLASGRHEVTAWLRPLR